RSASDVSRGGGAGNRTQVRKLRASCLYVRIRQTVSPRIAPAGGLSSRLFTCLIFAFRPVTRPSAIQFGHALRRVLEDPSVGRLSDLLTRQRERLRYRSQLWVPRVFTWASGPRYAAMRSLSPSKPFAP